MAAQEAMRVLDEKVRALSEDFDEKLGEAVKRVVESLEGRVESLTQSFGPTAVGERMKRYSIWSPGGTLYAIFRPMVAQNDVIEEAWEVDEEP
jgi:hypothetical protein